MTKDAQLLPLSRPDHQGARYTDVLSAIHSAMKPQTYLEIGTQGGRTLAISTCASLAVDPLFKITTRTPLGDKPVCALFQMTSDDFFAKYSPQAVFGRRVDFAFLDGMHLSEYLLRDFMNTERHLHAGSLVAMHDCLPVETTIALRVAAKGRVEPHRAAWWTGDVWRAVLALKKYRPDLNIVALDAPPTGLIVISNVDPDSTLLSERYPEIKQWMMEQDIEDIGLDRLFEELSVESTAAVCDLDRFRRRFPSAEVQS